MSVVFFIHCLISRLQAGTRTEDCILVTFLHAYPRRDSVFPLVDGFGFLLKEKQPSTLIRCCVEYLTSPLSDREIVSA